MLKFINEELFSFQTVQEFDKKNKREYTKIKVVSSNKIQQYEREIKKRERYASIDNRKRQDFTSHVDKLIPLNREILKISAPLKKIENALLESSLNCKMVDFNSPMSININNANIFQPLVDVRCHNRGEDNANLYIIAFPFNGMIKPIKESSLFRIYKGLIAASAKPFFFNNRKYRKVLYLVVEINKRLFDPAHKYHRTSIDINLESYALFTDRESDEKRTNCEYFTLRILSDKGDYETEWSYSTVNEAIMMNVAPGEQLWPTYIMSNHNNKSDNYKKPYNKKSYQKPVSRSGNLLVTTNKHGIRKEITMNNHRNVKNSGNRYDIEQMMAESGMYETDNFNRSKKNGGKKNYKKR